MKMPLVSNEAEQSVLGGLLMRNDLYWEIQGIITANDFARSDHKLIFQIISILATQEKPFDTVTMSEYLANDGKLEAVGGMLYVGELVKSTPSASNAKNYADIVAKYSRARNAVGVMTDGMSRLNDSTDTDSVISDIQSRLESTATGLGNEKQFMDVLRAGVDSITENRERRLSNQLPGISYTLPALDERTGGARKGQLIVIAARPSVGKTAYAHQIALHAAMEGNHIGEISIEMSEQQLAIRSLANRFKVNGTALMFGHDKEIQIVTDGLASDPGFRGIPLHVDTASDGYNAIVSRIVEWKHKYNISLAIVDHLGLIRCEGFGNNNDRIGYITSNLKKLAKRLDLPIIVVSQFSRGVEKDKRRPVLSDLRDSGSIEQDADICIFMHQEAEDEDDGRIEFGLLKNRDGMRGWLPEQICFRKKTQEVYQC